MTVLNYNQWDLTRNRSLIWYGIPQLSLFLTHSVTQTLLDYSHVHKP